MGSWKKNEMYPKNKFDLNAQNHLLGFSKHLIIPSDCTFDFLSRLPKISSMLLFCSHLGIHTCRGRFWQNKFIIHKICPTIGFFFDNAHSLPKMWSTLWSLIDMYKEDFLLRRYIWHFVHFCMRENKGQIGGLGKKLEIETLQNLQIVHPQCAPTNLGTHTGII